MTAFKQFLFMLWIYFFGGGQSNPDVMCYIDGDGDTYGDPLDPGIEIPSDDCDVLVDAGTYSLNNTDCDDEDFYVFENCSVVEDVMCYIDSDGDGFGDPLDPGIEIPSDDCDALVSDGWHSLNNSDCNDEEFDVQNICYTLCFRDTDGDGYGDSNDSGLAVSELTCTLIEGSWNNTDCDDEDFDVFENCGDVTMVNCYPDFDGDGFGDDGEAAIQRSECEADEVEDNTDCDDDDDDVSPAEIEEIDEGNCDDNIDNDCSGEDDADQESCLYLCIDDDDADGFGDEDDDGTLREECQTDEVDYEDGDDLDCDDDEFYVNPNEDEFCDGNDNDCDDKVDESGACDHLTQITFTIEIEEDLDKLELFGARSDRTDSPEINYWYGRGQLAADGVISNDEVFLVNMTNLESGDIVEVTLSGDIDDEFWFNGFATDDNGQAHHIVDENGNSDFIDIEVEEELFGIWDVNVETNLGTAESESYDGQSFTDYDDDGYPTDWDNNRAAIVVSYDN